VPRPRPPLGAHGDTVELDHPELLIERDREQARDGEPQLVEILQRVLHGRHGLVDLLHGDLVCRAAILGSVEAAPRSTSGPSPGCRS